MTEQLSTHTTRLVQIPNWISSVCFSYNSFKLKLAKKRNPQAQEYMTQLITKKLVVARKPNLKMRIKYSGSLLMPAAISSEHRGKVNLKYNFAE